MTITVIGAGTIGAAIAQDLHDQAEVELVQVCDARARSLQALHEHVQGPRIRSFQIDARDLFVLRTIIAGSTVVIGAVPGNNNAALAELCIEMGIHYCDLGGADAVVSEMLALDAQARAHGVWVVPNCGLAPGLVNVLCMHGLDLFSRPRTVQLRVGDIPIDPTPPFNFCVAWSPERIIEDYTNPAQTIDGGVLQQHEPMTRLEHLHFPEPFGELEAFCTQGGLATLARDLVGRVETLDHKTIRWPGHAAQMRFVLLLGFGESKTIDVRTHLTYRDVLVRRMRQRLSDNQRDVVLLRVLIQGEKDGREQTLVFQMVLPYDDVHHTTAMRRATAIPTSVLARMLGENRIAGGGAAPPEHIVDRAAFLDDVRARGLDIEETWYEGVVDVTDASFAQPQPSAEP